jgi:hypothetical protein
MSQHARNLVIMLTAGGSLNDLLKIAQAWKIRAVHIQQLAVPAEEQKAQEILVNALRQRVGA